MEREVILMIQNDKRYHAQLVKYFERVIVNRSINYYTKKFGQHEREKSIEDPTIEFVDPITEDKELRVPNIIIFNVKLYIDNDDLEQVINQMTDREKFFIIQKFVFKLTDNEIGQLLGISRQGITNFKHRLYRSIRRKLNK